MTMADGKAKTSTPNASRLAFHSGESLEPIDLHFGRFIERLGGEVAPSLFLAAALVSRSAREGSICLDLNTVASKMAPLEAGMPPQQYPDLTSWRMDLLKSAVVGKPGEERPLILDDASRLYLHRYWEYEAELARFLIQKGRASAKSFMPKGIDRERLRDGLKRLFPTSDGATGGEGKGGMDWQKVAALATVLQNLTVISGGPGTGKTITAAKAIILLLEQSPGQKLRIALTAPTGKAAARLQEVISRIGEQWGSDPQIRAMTIHRLLGSLPHSSRFRHHRGNPLQVDIVVVDEASMVDLPLLAKLIHALPEHARLILLGDRNQLASVEAGAVLSDICGEHPLNHFTPDFADLVTSLTDCDAATPSLSMLATSPSRIQDCLIELQTN
ncbi:MAG: AAA family ATPase, partial [Deltaproteobacteria bacterium]